MYIIMDERFQTSYIVEKCYHALVMICKRKKREKKVHGGTTYPFWGIKRDLEVNRCRKLRFCQAVIEVGT